MRPGGVPAQQPHSDRRHDQSAKNVGEVRRRDQPQRVAHKKKQQGKCGREQRGKPRHIGFERTLGKPARNKPILTQLRQRSGRTAQRLQAAEKQIEQHEPDSHGLGHAAKHRRERGAQDRRKVLGEIFRTQHAQPDQR